MKREKICMNILKIVLINNKLLFINTINIFPISINIFFK